MADLILSHKIPDADAVEAVAAFVAVHPNITRDPALWAGDPLADADWLEHRLVAWLNEQVNDGRRRLHSTGNPPAADRDFAAKTVPK